MVPIKIIHNTHYISNNPRTSNGNVSILQIEDMYSGHMLVCIILLVGNKSTWWFVAYAMHAACIWRKDSSYGGLKHTYGGKLVHAVICDIHLEECRFVSGTSTACLNTSIRSVLSWWFVTYIC